MNCQRCNSSRVLSFQGKCSDLFYGELNGNSIDGYVPHDLNIGGGDYVHGDVCLNCGQLQGTWPLERASLEPDASIDVEATDEYGEYIRDDSSARKERKRRERTQDTAPTLEAMHANIALTRQRKQSVSLIAQAYRGN